MTQEEDMVEHNENSENVKGADEDGEYHQEQQPHEAKESNPATDGYTADVSSASKSGNDSDLPNNSSSGEDKLGLVIEIIAHKTKNPYSIRRRSHRHKKSPSHSVTHSFSVSDRKRKRSHSRRQSSRRKKRSTPTLLAASPIHPEIDISLTQHIAVKNGLLCHATDAVLQGAVVSNGGSSQNEQNASATETTTDEIASSMPALSNAVLKYFSDLPREVAADSRRHATPTSIPKYLKQFDAPVSKAKKDITRHKPPNAPVISDVALFSDQPYQLEDALEITDTPRLLLEGTSPHRIIHVNAAFSKHIIMASSGQHSKRTRKNAQEWIETQNQSLLSNKNRSLQEAIEEIIPENASLPLTCYPVLGSSNRTSHYLVEATTSNANPRFDTNRRQNTMKLYKPFEAVG